MKKWLRLIAFAMAFNLNSAAHAAGAWTPEVIPDKVEVVRSQGIAIFGAFGNPGPTPCDHGDLIWVAVSHPQYDKIYAMAMTAVASGLKLQAYLHQCTSFGWHGGSGTHNEMTGAGAMYLVR